MDTAKARPAVDNAFLSEMEGLRMLARKVFKGQVRGERRSKNKGQSVEFVDFRPYIRGDDLRRIDWNLYGRLERFYIKLFEEEEDLRLYILLDHSASMDYGNPNKFDHARRLAAALSYIVLSNLETVAVSIFAGGYQVLSTPVRGKGKIHPVIHGLNNMVADGDSQLAAAASRFAAQLRRSGLICIISDFLTPDSIDAIAPLFGAGHQIELVQVLAPEEVNPGLTGDLELVDAESGETREVSMGLGVMRKYHRRLAALQSELKSFALKSGGDYFLCNTASPLRDFIFGPMRTSRLIR